MYIINFIFSDPLTKSIYLAYKARKNFLSSGTSITMSSTGCLKQASRSGELLRESLCLTLEHKQKTVRQVKGVIVLTLFE